MVLLIHPSNVAVTVIVSLPNTFAAVNAGMDAFNPVAVPSIMPTEEPPVHVNTTSVLTGTVFKNIGPTSSPRHNGPTLFISAISNSPSETIVTVTLVVHELSSVMVTSYIPDPRSIAVAPVCIPAVAGHAYVYGVVPPVALTVALPTSEPSQVVLDILMTSPINCVGSVISTKATAVQPS